jgi:hypothetical protein
MAGRCGCATGQMPDLRCTSTRLALPSIMREDRAASATTPEDHQRRATSPEI